MNEYNDPPTPKDLARILLMEEQNLKLLHNAWESKTKELVAALKAVASEILGELPQPTRSEHVLEVWGERLPHYHEWYDIALNQGGPINLFQITAKSPFGIARFACSIGSPEATSGYVPDGQVAIKLGEFWRGPWTREITPYQGQFVVAESISGSSQVFSGLTARDIARRIWGEAVSRIKHNPAVGA